MIFNLGPLPRADEKRPNWWRDCGEIARLLRWLNDNVEHGPLEVAHCIDICEKPWHWDAEYSEMCREQETESEAKENERLASGEDAADSEELK